MKATAPALESNVEEIRRVPIRDLRLDSSYQRDLDLAKVRKMVNAWDERRAQVVILSSRAGILWIVDGQHRVAAARELGHLHVTAQINAGMTQGEEADLFVELQRGRKNLNAWDLFKAELVAAHPEVLDLIRVVNVEQFKIDRTGGQNHIAAVGALRRIWRLGGEELLVKVLRTIRMCWMGDRRGLDGQTLEGLGVFFHSFMHEAQYNELRALNILQETPATSFLRAAQEIAQSRASVSSSATNVAEAIRNKYNERLRKRDQKLGQIRMLHKAVGR